MGHFILESIGGEKREKDDRWCCPRALLSRNGKRKAQRQHFELPCLTGLSASTIGPPNVRQGPTVQNPTSKREHRTFLGALEDRLRAIVPSCCLVNKSAHEIASRKLPLQNPPDRVNSYSETSCQPVQHRVAPFYCLASPIPKHWTGPEYRRRRRLSESTHFDELSLPFFNSSGRLPFLSSPGP